MSTEEAPEINITLEYFLYYYKITFNKAGLLRHFQYINTHKNSCLVVASLLLFCTLCVLRRTASEHRLKPLIATKHPVTHFPFVWPPARGQEQ